MGEAYASGKVDYTYKRPSRRWNPFGVIFPSMFAPKPSVAIVADTSGSMGKTDITKVLQETRGCMKHAHKVWFIPTDARAHACIKINNIAQARDVMVGGGGTDMGAGLEASGSMHPTLTVVVTDGITDWPRYMPEGNKKVLIIRVNEGGRSWKTPEWAEVIDISVD
jgi:predicted metal-dependent peptidase